MYMQQFYYLIQFNKTMSILHNCMFRGWQMFQLLVSLDLQSWFISKTTTTEVKMSFNENRECAFFQYEMISAFWRILQWNNCWLETPPGQGHGKQGCTWCCSTSNEWQGTYMSKIHRHIVPFTWKWHHLIDNFWWINIFY